MTISTSAAPLWDAQGLVGPVAWSADPPLHRWSLEEYERAVNFGVLTPGMRVELIDGLITEKMPNDPPHASTVARLNRFFMRGEGSRWLARCQLPVRLPGQRSEPEPDIAVCRPDPGDYAGQHPGPQDIFLLIEVADSSLLADRQRKGPLYARAEILEYWIVNVAERTLETFCEPDAAAGVYRRMGTHGVGASVAPAAFPDAAVAVAALFAEEATELPGGV